VPRVTPVDLGGRGTVAKRLKQCGAPVKKRLKPYFRKAGVKYPPGWIVLVGLKKERRLELYAGDGRRNLRFIKAYPVLAASGCSGPKLRQGDKQVPEGLYRIQALNPNSRYHLSLRLNYPNRFDRAMGKQDKRWKLGGDIMIHGNSVSAGFLAMGDVAAEEIFVLAARTGLKRIRLIFSPVDFRKRDVPFTLFGLPTWTDKLYAHIKRELGKLPRSLPSGKYVGKPLSHEFKSERN
jgi:hypothetical protein